MVIYTNLAQTNKGSKETTVWEAQLWGDLEKLWDFVSWFSTLVVVNAADSYLAWEVRTALSSGNSLEKKILTQWPVLICPQKTLCYF